MSEQWESGYDTNSTFSHAHAYQAPDTAGANWADLVGGDAEELGDLSDVPERYLQEVAELIRSLPSPDEDPGEIDNLRAWILTLSRLAGFSREATVQLFRCLAQLLEAPRPKGQNMPTRVSLQQAFVRMKGVRETINIMLMRLSDAVVVTLACRVLTAAVQGSPLTAEFMLDDRPENIRLMLRAIERHQGDFEVAETGCLLISHLCSQAPVPGISASPVRARGHRDCQTFLVREAGAIGLVVNILAVSMETIKAEADIVTKMHAAATLNAKNQSLKSSSVRNAGAEKGNDELAVAWDDLHNTEGVVARVQAAALQALLLLGFGNADTTRQLAGQLWCWGNTRGVELRQEALIAAKLEKSGSAGAGKGRGRGNAAPKRQAGGLTGQRDKKELLAAEEKAAAIAETEAKCSLMTLDAFETTCMLLVEVIRGLPCRDRPAIAAQACRILKMLVERGLGLLRHVEHGKNKHQAEFHCVFDGVYDQSNAHLVALRPGPIPDNNRKALAPFTPLVSLVAALTFAVRQHSADPPLLAEAMSLLMKLKSLSLESAPAGMDPGNEHLLYAWQRMLGEAEEKEELADACKVLQRSLDYTVIGNNRIANGSTVEQLSGDAVFLTPRMAEFVQETHDQATEIAGDALARKWRNGEPGRTKYQEKAPSRYGSENGPASPKGSGKGVFVSPKREGGRQGNSPFETPTKAAQRGSVTPGSDRPGSRSKLSAPGGHSRNEKPERHRRGSTEISSKMAQALSSIEDGAKEASQPAPKVTAAQKRKTLQEEKPQKEVKVQPEWRHAVGFDTCNEVEFARLWEEPLTDALSRSLSMPSLQGQRQAKHRESISAGLSSSASESGLRSLMQTAAEEPLRVEFLSSEPGLLKAKLILHSQDAQHQSVTDFRLKQLTDENVSNAEVAPVLAKYMRKSGHVLPKYGVQVIFKRGRRTSALASAGEGLVSSPSKSF